MLVRVRAFLPVWVSLWVVLLLGAGRVMGQGVAEDEEPVQAVESVPNIFDDLSRGVSGTLDGRVIVEQPGELRDLVERLARAGAHDPGFEGYRVLVYRGLGAGARETAAAVRDLVWTHWAGLPVYVSYTSPYYRVCVGDCRSRHEAEAMRTHLSSVYPQCFVVAERVNYPLRTLEEIFYRKAQGEEEAAKETH